MLAQQQRPRVADRIRTGAEEPRGVRHLLIGLLLGALAFLLLVASASALELAPGEGVVLDGGDAAPRFYQLSSDAPQPAPPVDPIRLRVVLGATSGFMTGLDEPEVEPAALLAATWKLAGSERPLSAVVTLELTAAPGDAVDLESTPASFRSLGMSFGASWKGFPKVAAAGHCEAGFSSRYQTRGHEPAKEAPKWAGCGVRFTTDSRNAHLQITGGPDQRLSGRYLAAIQVSGAMDLAVAKSGRLQGSALAILVRAVLGMERDPRDPDRRDVVTLTLAASWGEQ